VQDRSTLVTNGVGEKPRPSSATPQTNNPFSHAVFYFIKNCRRSRNNTVMNFINQSKNPLFVFVFSSLGCFRNFQFNQELSPANAPPLPPPPKNYQAMNEINGSLGGASVNAPLRAESDTRLFTATLAPPQKPHQLDSLLDELQSLGGAAQHQSANESDVKHQPYTNNVESMAMTNGNSNVITVNDLPDESDLVPMFQCLYNVYFTRIFT